MTDILLTPQPEKQAISKVWFDGKWENADQAGIPVKENGKIKQSDLPDVPMIVDKWDQEKSYKRGQVIMYQDSLYKALSDMPASPFFVQAMINTDTNGFFLLSDPKANTIVKEYGNLRSENHLFKYGELIYNDGQLYRCIQETPNASISDLAYFTPIRSDSPTRDYSIGRSYEAGEFVMYAGHVISANATIPTGIDFKWGTTGRTFKPKFHNGRFNLNWRGVAAQSQISYNLGDVIVLSDTANEIYCCTSANDFNNSGAKLDLRFWVPVVSGFAQTGQQDYLSRSNDIVALDWKINVRYDKGAIVRYTDGILYTSNDAMPINTAWVIGTTGATWRAVNDLSKKQDTITGAASTVVTNNLAASCVVVTDANGKLSSNSNITTTEVSYLDGVTSSIQTQINNKQDKNHTAMGYDLVQAAQPKAIYRDKFLTSGVPATTISAANVPWVYANIDQAERSLPYWIQQLTTFFKNLENDKQYDQLIGAIPSNFSIPFGSWGVAPSGSTDMDNNVFIGTGNYASEYYEFIVGKNPSGTEIYTFQFTFASQANAADITLSYPFSMIFQTTRGTTSHNFQSTVSGIAAAIPRCTARPWGFSTSSYNGAAFPLMYEPITLEISK
ncbi:hypothetical protein [Aeromonas salmonicida]|uniref:hypothetical protein n=1 Tax=Aeromonas salmonicida TaxID=645 RepID=UPI003D323876